jgi:hypothetical protein
MRTLYTWGDGEYCWSDDDPEEDVMEEWLSGPCPACGQRYRECVCDHDPFAEESDGR